jgi:hypothetical protein
MIKTYKEKNMNLDSILKYQQIDIKLFKIEIELRGSEEYKNLALYKKLTIDAKDMLFKLDKKSEDMPARSAATCWSSRTASIFRCRLRG